MSERPISVVMGPMNLANMPYLLVQELRELGHRAAHVQYTNGQAHPFGFTMDEVVNLKEMGGRIDGMTEVLSEKLSEGYEIFHFWNRSFFYRGDYGNFAGFDIPFIKARGRKIVYRFSGFDVRLPHLDLEYNPYSPFRYGYVLPYPEERVRGYHSFLAEYVDTFLVQDPELGQFRPDAGIIPRTLDLSQWPVAETPSNDVPLVVHAPTNPIVKGTPFVMQAVESLQRKGVRFEFKVIENMSHEEAKGWFRMADIVVDQLLIGATGVLTLENWALGKCVLVNLRKDLFEPFYETDSLPCVNANPDTIEDSLHWAIEHPQERVEIGRSARLLVEKFHNVKNVTPKLVDVYRDTLASSSRRPTGYGDVDYLRMQAHLDVSRPVVAPPGSKFVDPDRQMEDGTAVRAGDEVLDQMISELATRCSLREFSGARVAGIVSAIGLSTDPRFLRRAIRTLANNGYYDACYLTVAAYGHIYSDRFAERFLEESASDFELRRSKTEFARYAGSLSSIVDALGAMDL